MEGSFARCSAPSPPGAQRSTIPVKWLTHHKLGIYVRIVIEASHISILDLLLGGAAETRVDHEIAPDRRWNHRSVRQVLSGTSRSGRAPTVVPIDANGVEDGIEYRIETAARAAPVARPAGTRRCARG